MTTLFPFMGTTGDVYERTGNLSFTKSIPMCSLASVTTEGPSSPSVRKVAYEKT